MRALFLLSALLIALLLPVVHAEDGDKQTREKPPVKVVTDLPYGMAIEGKPGYVTSPYAPAAGSVDVRGFPAWTKVKCPYTGRNFLVPAEAVRAEDADPDRLPTATPVPGKPGFVFSPFTDEVVHISVQGMPRGTKVKDPFSNKEFFVP